MIELAWRVLLKRDGCIGAGTCAAVYPDGWVMNEDNSKVSLVNGKTVGSNQELIIEDKETLEKFLTSAEVCPVNVIEVYDLEKGEMIFPRKYD